MCQITWFCVVSGREKEVLWGGVLPCYQHYTWVGCVCSTDSFIMNLFRLGFQGDVGSFSWFHGVGSVQVERMEQDVYAIEKCYI